MGLTQAEFAAFTNKVSLEVKTQIELKAVTYGKIPTMSPSEDNHGVVDIDAGGATSSKGVRDGGAFGTPSYRKPSQGTYFPKFHSACVQIARGEARLTQSAKAGVELMRRNINSMVEGHAMMLNRLLIDPQLHTNTVEIASTATEFNVDDVSGFVMNMSFDVFNPDNVLLTSSTARPYVVDIYRNIDTGGGTITINAAFGVTIPANSKFYLPGYGPEGSDLEDVGPINLAQVCSETADLYGIAVTTKLWRGNELDMGGSLSILAFDRFDEQIKARSGNPNNQYTYVTCDANVNRYRNLGTGALRFTVGEAIDPTGGSKQPVYKGERNFLVDNQVPRDSIFCIPLSMIKRHVWVEAGFEGATWDSRKRALDMGVVLAVPDSLNYRVNFWGAENFRVERRGAFGLMSGITD